jgi:hypothetical protein
MMAWVYALPAWLLMPAVVIVACALTGIALYLTRERLTRNDLITHNDVAGAILQMLGTVLAVMMSFMVAGVWQQYDAAGQNTQTEAGALADLYHIAAVLPQPTHNQVQAGVDQYINLLLTDEWPLMKQGGESLRAHDAAYHLEDIVANFRPATPQAILIQSQAMAYASRFVDARRERIRDNRTGIPNVLWSAMLALGLITIFFSFYFKVDRPVAQHIMVGALTAVIALIFMLIAELDYPFRGDIAIHPDAYTSIFRALHNLGFQH